MAVQVKVKRPPRNSNLKPGEIRELDGWSGEDDTFHVAGTPFDDRHWYPREHFEVL